MNRKQFLRRSILFSLAATGLPRLSYALQGSGGEDVYRKVIKVGEGEHEFRTSFNQAKLMSKESDASIRLVLDVAFYAGYSWAADAEAKALKGRYALQRVGAPTQEGKLIVCKWKVAKVEGEDVIKGRFQKTAVTRLYPRRLLSIIFSDKDFIDLSFVDTSRDADDDCFLTTACTAAKGLPDDCRELTTLRRLRDMHMKTTVRGAALIQEYYQIAPGIVQAVNARSNSMPIWSQVYEDLVIPTVTLTDAGRIDEAVSHYAQHAGWMKEAFTATTN